MNNFVVNLYNKYENLPPKQKAAFDMLGMLVSAIIGSVVVAFVAVNGWWGELAFCFVIYALYGMLSLLYKSRVAHYEFQEKYKK